MADEVRRGLLILYLKITRLYASFFKFAASPQRDQMPNSSLLTLIPGDKTNNQANRKSTINEKGKISLHSYYSN